MKIQNQKYVVIYAGRFQPFHSSHKETYDSIVKEFGKDNVFIATSDKVEPPRSPFTFDEKKKIITTMYSDIPADKIVQVKNGYRPVEILDQFPPETVAIFVIGEKDAERLGNGKYFHSYEDADGFEGYSKKGYYYVASGNSGMSGTKIREVFNSDDVKEKEKLFKEMYGNMNKEIFELMNNKITNVSEEVVPSFLMEDAPVFLINEGGAYGHLNHFHDVKSNTFGDLREFINKALEGKMEHARLKTDGMNLMFSFVDGQIRFARNKSDLKNFGANAMKTNDLSGKFEGRENIQKSFVSASRDLQHAFGKLPKETLNKYFDNGKNWMSVEILHPSTVNVIPYGVYELRFHGIKSYDEKGNPVGEDLKSADKLAKMITDMKENKQKTFEIKSLEVATFPPMPDFKAQKAYFEKKVDNLQDEFGMKDKNTLGDVFYDQFQRLIKSHAKEARYTIPKNVLEGLINRWAFEDSAFSIREIKAIDNDTFKDWVISFDKDGAKQYAKKISRKFELLTLELGVRVLKNLSSFMVANPQQSVQKLKKAIDDVITKVQATDDPALMDKMKKELERLTAIGGVDAIAPEEGITFLFKDNFYKLTGAFAPVNQLLGLLRYKR